mmetsp:Transcript_97236/g.175674  ORF Transcript_97236/g.175674 Transcript_97236/m.175674 type:complete len:119 (+) Transcript_97236:80-436(+)
MGCGASSEPKGAKLEKCVVTVTVTEPSAVVPLTASLPAVVTQEPVKDGAPKCTAGGETLHTSRSGSKQDTTADGAEIRPPSAEASIVFAAAAAVAATAAVAAAAAAAVAAAPLPVSNP